MKIYNIYIKNSNTPKLEEAIFIETGFSLKAFLFSVFWFGYHKMWFMMILAICLFAALDLAVMYNAIDKNISMAFEIIIMASFGMFATQIRSFFLEKKNYILHDVICTNNLSSAQLKYFERNHAI